jgi:hypothetical protein
VILRHGVFVATAQLMAKPGTEYIIKILLKSYDSPHTAALKQGEGPVSFAVSIFNA